MGTKSNPGAYDCYANAEPDEPMFVLLARDVMASYFTAAWAAVRCGDMTGAVDMLFKARNALEDANKPIKDYGDAKIAQAIQCARQMREWLLAKRTAEAEGRLTGDNL